MDDRLKELRDELATVITTREVEKSTMKLAFSASLKEYDKETRRLISSSKKACQRYADECFKAGACDNPEDLVT